MLFWLFDITTALYSAVYKNGIILDSYWCNLEQNEALRITGKASGWNNHRQYFPVEETGSVILNLPNNSCLSWHFLYWKSGWAWKPLQNISNNTLVTCENKEKTAVFYILKKFFWDLFLAIY